MKPLLWVLPIAALTAACTPTTSSSTDPAFFRLNADEVDGVRMVQGQAGSLWEEGEILAEVAKACGTGIEGHAFTAPDASGARAITARCR